ncbi:hypothetical protein NM688_g8857 [Phlebia brevispora]|uniref:Uncharacterized protein n=1 Tax=Phlebia brevispora TaxID=194682 RepID=A0ACC1RQS4_9APHY|nr:hypothetical protein NM688_g8857 [Phlebia brevispora]
MLSSSTLADVFPANCQGTPGQDPFHSEHRIHVPYKQRKPIPGVHLISPSISSPHPLAHAGLPSSSSPSFSPSLLELARDDDAFTKLIFSLFGLYVWELFQTGNFEWSLLTRKRKFAWPLGKCQSRSSGQCTHLYPVFFFLCRYCMFFSLLGLIISLSVTTPTNCMALYTFDSWSGNMAILSASTSLMLRTIALWQRDRRVVAILGFFCLAHWAILWRGMFIVHGAYSATDGGCVVTSTNHVFLNVSFFTTMGFDLVVLCFTIAALLRQKSHSGLWKLLFQDGLVYFCVTFLCNALPAIFNVLNLNTMMNVIATIPAATVASIASCRLVMRLQEYNQDVDAYVHSARQMSAGATARGQIHFNKPFAMPRTPEIMVTTDQIIMKDFSPASFGRSTKRDSTRHSRKMDLEATEAYSDFEFEGPEEPPKALQPFSVRTAAVPFADLRDPKKQNNMSTRGKRKPSSLIVCAASAPLSVARQAGHAY